MSDEQIDDLLDAGEGQAPTKAFIELQIRINERRRKRRHAAAKAAQPALKTEWHPDDLAAAVAEIHKPLTAQEADMSGMDDLCRDVEESEGTLHDLLFALVRVYRKERAWQRHVSPLTLAQERTEESVVTMDAASRSGASAP